ncbi:MAG: VacJ family lipoprotein [Parvularculaceae bacterium]
MVNWGKYDNAALALALAIALTSPAAAQLSAGDEAAAPLAAAADAQPDPWQGFNRNIFAANNVVDDVLFVPAAKGYRAVTPKAGRRGIRRFLSNLGAPSVFVNDLLQGEFSRAGDTLSRFVINSTIGAGGFADPAAQMGIEGHNEDFGQTLAVWGVASGPYLVLPLLGPSSPRDAFGTIVETGLNPLTYARTPPANIARLSLAGTTLVSAREQFIEPLAEIEASSLDYYSSFRSFYTQSRTREINNGVTNYDALPTFDDLEDTE